MKGKKNMKWSSHQDERLIQCMVKQRKEGRSIQGGFTAEGWNEITKQMIKYFGPKFVKDKLKNRFKTFKRNYSVMKTLLNLSGFRWDEEKKMITAEASIWEEYVAAHPKVGPYRLKILPDYHTLAQIFGDSVANGRERYATNDPGTPDSTPADRTSPMRTPVEEENNDYSNLQVHEEISLEHFSSATTSNRKSAGPSAQPSRKIPKTKANVGMDLVGAMETMAKAIVEIATKQAAPRPTMKECLDALGPLNLTGDLKFRAITLLQIDRKAETFIALDPTDRLPWLMMELQMA